MWCSESGDCPQGAYNPILGSEFAGSTAKTIIQPATSQHWVREGGRGSHQVENEAARGPRWIQAQGGA